MKEEEGERGREDREKIEGKKVRRRKGEEGRRGRENKGKIEGGKSR